MNDKKCPVDRGKVLIALELCRLGTIKRCHNCPYRHFGCATRLAKDCLKYICYLEQQLEEAEKA